MFLLNKLVLVIIAAIMAVVFTVFIVASGLAILASLLFNKVFKPVNKYNEDGWE